MDSNQITVYPSPVWSIEGPNPQDQKNPVANKGVMTKLPAAKIQIRSATGDTKRNQVENPKIIRQQ